MNNPFLQFHRQGGGFIPLLLCALGLAGTLTVRAGVAPTVSAITASQQGGTKLVNISYNLADPDSSAISIYVQVSSDAGATWTVPAYTFTGAYGGGVTPGNGKTIVWNAGVDWDGQYSTNCRVRVIANDSDAEGFVQIPAGSFQMGDTFNEGDPDELPVHAVTVSTFYMEKTEVTGARWKAVYQWALAHAYAFDHAGSFTASTNPIQDHPVHSLNWFDTVKWCNARSEFEGRTAACYTDAGLTTLYRSGQAAPFVNWSANGYRLPTEAEWEKAARGGLSGKRYPWGDTITTNQANYAGTNTSPVASFLPNSYGLFDMAGNVFEFCWDWYDSGYYSSSPGTDPHGPNGPLTGRMLRGGSWIQAASFERCANRYADLPGISYIEYGFRCVRGP